MVLGKTLMGKTYVSLSTLAVVKTPIQVASASVDTTSALSASPIIAFVTMTSIDKQLQQKKAASNLWTILLNHHILHSIVMTVSRNRCVLPQAMIHSPLKLRKVSCRFLSIHRTVCWNHHWNLNPLMIFPWVLQKHLN